jgi:hypothetical protein
MDLKKKCVQNMVKNRLIISLNVLLKCPLVYHTHDTTIFASLSVIHASSPIAHVIQGRILVVHGGICITQSFNDLRAYVNPLPFTSCLCCLSFIH